MKCPYCFKEIESPLITANTIYLCPNHAVDVHFNSRFRSIKNDEFMVIVDAHLCTTTFLKRKDDLYFKFLMLQYVHEITPDTFDHYMNKMKTWIVFS